MSFTYASEVAYEGIVPKASEKLSALCKVRSIKIDDLMKLTGWSRSTVSRHVNSVIEPDFEQRRIYEKLLRLPEHWLESDDLPTLKPTAQEVLKMFNALDTEQKMVAAGEINQAASHLGTSRREKEAREKRKGK